MANYRLALLQNDADAAPAATFALSGVEPADNAIQPAARTSVTSGDNWVTLGKATHADDAVNDRAALLLELKRNAAGNIAGATYADLAHNADKFLPNANRARFDRDSGIILGGQQLAEEAEDERLAKEYAKQPAPPVADEDDEEDEQKDTALPKGMATEGTLDAATAPDPGRRRGLPRLGVAAALYRGGKTFSEKLREEPKPKGKGLREAEKLGADAKQAEGIAGDAAKARKLGGELEAGAQGLREAGIAAREIGSGAKTLWEGSRLLRIGGAVAAGTAVAATGIVMAPVVMAGVVAGGALLIGASYSGSLARGAQAAVKWGGEALVPTAAREAFAKGDILKGVDETLGLSAFWDFSKKIAGAAKDGIVAAWNDPAKAKQTIIAAAGTAEKYRELTVAVFSNDKTRNAAGNVIGAAVTGEDTTKNLLALNTAAMGDKTVMSKLSALQPSPYGAMRSANDNDDADPAATNTGGDARRPRSNVTISLISLPQPEMN